MVWVFVFYVFAKPELAGPSPARQLARSMRPHAITVTIHRDFLESRLDCIGLTGTVSNATIGVDETLNIISLRDTSRPVVSNV